MPNLSLIKDKTIMKKFIFLLSAILLLIQGTFAQNPSTLGKDFWVTYLPNAWPSTNGNPTLTLIITGMRNCSGVVNNPNTGWSTNFSVTAGNITNVTIPISQAYTTGSEMVTNTGIHITSTDTISCYASNFIDASFDITNVLPTPTLMEEYIIQTYPSPNECEFVILATENNTTVDITLADNTANGRYAGSTYSVTLQRGQCYQVQTLADEYYYYDSDFTGTRICARDCKKLAVFQGDLCANIPSTDYCCCDHIVEQSIPVAYWGKKFVVTTSSYRYNDVVRITALNNNCQVRKNGSLLTTLNAGQTYQFTMQNSEASAYIETTEPACVYLYFTGYDYGSYDGDPSSVVINPIEQQIDEITFGTFATTNSVYHVVNIITETANVGGVVLDGQNVSSQFTTVSGNPTYSYAKISITNGSHTLRNTMGGFVAHIYGLGWCESYSYTAGSSTVNLNAQLYVNDIASASLQNGTSGCPYFPLTFHTQVEYPYTGINWDFGDGGSGSGETVVHQYSNPGDYNVRVIIERVTSNCFNDFYDTLYTMIHIAPILPHVTQATICPGMTYTFNGNVYTEEGRYVDTIPSSGLCDSIDVLELTLSGVIPDITDVTICPGETYNFRGITYSAAGRYEETVHTPGECDSLIVLNLTYSSIPSPNLGPDRTLCYDNQFPVVLNPGSYTTYTWNTGATSQTLSINEPGTYYVTVANEDGCIGSDTVTIKKVNEITVEIENQTEDFCEAFEATLVVHTNASNIVWSTGDTTTTLVVHSPGNYVVTAFDGECNQKAMEPISPCSFDLYLPNCITPTNVDGNNDYFYIPAALNIEEIEIFIYDRWGMLVYHSTDPYFKWDGSVNGKIETLQVYSYVLFIKPKGNPQKQRLGGILTVI